jgi:hypothetical protein
MLRNKRNMDRCRHMFVSPPPQFENVVVDFCKACRRVTYVFCISCQMIDAQRGRWIMYCTLGSVYVYAIYMYIYIYRSLYIYNNNIYAFLSSTCPDSFGARTVSTQHTRKLAWRINVEHLQMNVHSPITKVHNRSHEVPCGTIWSHMETSGTHLLSCENQNLHV